MKKYSSPSIKVIQCDAISIIAASGAARKPMSFYNSNQEIQKESCQYYCKKLSSFESFMNMGGGADKGLKYFSCNNCIVTIKMKTGDYIQSHLQKLNASFTIYSGDNVLCEVSDGRTSVKIFSVWHLFSDEEWYNIFNILTYCGVTHNVENYSALYQRQHSNLYKGAKYASSVIKIAKFLS